MRKYLFALVLSVFICGFGIMAVYAAPQVLLTDNDFSLKSGETYAVTALNSEYNNPVATLTIDSVKSGTKKNTFIIARYENGKYVYKSSLTKGITANTCSQVNFGYVAHGKLMYLDIAGNVSGESWAGWAGSVVLKSQ